MTPSTSPLDLQLFLVQRLREQQPETARRIAGMGDEELADLREEVLSALQADADSRLWALP